MPVIKKVVTKKLGSRPILIDFDNAKVKEECVKTLKAQLYETKVNEKLVAVTSDKLLYCGEVEDDDLYQNFVLVHKRDSDKIKLFQVDHVTVRAKLNKKRDYEISPQKDNAAAELNKQFGSKKAKRVTEQRERLTMNIDAVKQQLEQTVANYNNQALSWRILPLKKSLDTKNTETVTIQFADPGHLPDVGHVNYQILQNEPKYPNQCNMQVLQQSYVQEPPPPPPKVLNQLEEVKTPQIKEAKPKKKIHRLPIDGTLYHSQQLGLKVPPKKTLGTRGRIIESQAREVIHNVFKFMREEAQNGIKIPISNYRERVLRATGISKCTYYKITTREFKRGGPQPTKRKRLSGVSSQGVGVKVDNVEQVSENNSIYRPKINRDASTPDGVYNLEDLVEAYILDTLAVEAGKIIEAGSADQFGLCKFAATNINKILLSNYSEEEKIRSLTIFLYIHYLIKFMQTAMKSVTKKFVVCDKSVDINNHILKVFSEMGTNGRTRPLHMKDKALCYTMILAAIAMDFEVDVELLSKDLRIGMKKVVEVARILAFNMKANNKNIVQLKLPLPAPVTYTPKRGKR